MCINCGLCEKVCPLLHPFPKRKPLKIFAAINKDSTIREKSSSGGVFFELAKYVIDRGGYVYGAGFDGKWYVSHKRTNTIEGVYELMGSKYVQSDMNETFKDVRLKLEQKNVILFTGTPCQVAGLNHYLVKKYDHLITLDILCHGVPNNRIFQRFLHETLKKNQIPQNEVRNICFRRKVKGQNEYQFSMVDINGNEHNTYFYRLSYMHGFLSNLILRPSCYNCKAKQGRSQSDLTIGDLWNIYNVPPFNDCGGTNIICIHTDKGQGIINQCNLEIATIDRKYILRSNSGNLSKQFMNPRRAEFFNLFQNSDVEICTYLSSFSKIPIIYRAVRKMKRLLHLYD